MSCLKPGLGVFVKTRIQPMRTFSLAMLVLAFSTAVSSAAFAQNDSCGSPTQTKEWADAAAEHGQFTSNDEQIKFTVAFIYKHCSGGEVVELPQTVIALCNFNKAIVRMDPTHIVCVLVSR